MTLEQRVEKLERQNRWLKRGGVAGAAFIAAVMLMGQGKEKPRVVEAERFVLKNDKGKTQGQWVSGTVPKLTIGTTGEEMLRLTGSPRPDLKIFDQEGRVRIRVGPSLSGEPNIELYDKSGNRLWRAKEKEPQDLVARSVTIVDEAGDKKVMLFTREGSGGMLMRGDSAGMSLVDMNLVSRLSLYLSPYGSTSLFIRDADGELRIYMGTNPESTHLTIQDRNGRDRAILGTRANDAPALELKDAMGKVIWQAPEKQEEGK
jgi:hypothetical protein